MVAGHTSSSNFPTENAYDDTFGYSEAFVVKFSSTGVLQWSTFLGGDAGEAFPFITLDGNNEIIIGGYTYSSNFPTLNAYDNTHNGEADIFLCKMSYTGSLLWSTLLGGDSNDGTSTIAVDSSDNIVLAGYTVSSDFPTKDAYDNSHNGKKDATISKFSSSGELLWSTYLGGGDVEGDAYDQASVPNLVLDSEDNLLVEGSTRSPDFPTKNACDNSFNGYQDIFLSKISPECTLLWSTFLGSSSSDYGGCIAVDSESSIWVACDSYEYLEGRGSPLIWKLSATGDSIWGEKQNQSKSSVGFTIFYVIFSLCLVKMLCSKKRKWDY